MATENENIDTPLNLVISTDQGDDRNLARSRNKEKATPHLDTPELPLASHCTGDSLAYVPPIPHNVSLYPSPMRNMFVKKEASKDAENVANRNDSYGHGANRSILNVPSVMPGSYQRDGNMRNVPPMPSYIDQYNQIGAVKPLPHLNFEIKMKAFKNANSGAVSSDLAAKSKQIDKVIQKLKQKDLKPDAKTPVKQDVKKLNVSTEESDSGAYMASNSSAVSPKNKQIDSVIQKLKQLKEKSASAAVETVAKLGKRKVEKVTCTKCDCSPEPKKKKVSDPRNSLFTSTDQKVKKKLMLDTESVNVKKKQNKKENQMEQQSEKEFKVTLSGKQTNAKSKSLKSAVSPESVNSNSLISSKQFKECLIAQKCKAGQKSPVNQETTTLSVSNKISKSLKNETAKSVDVSNEVVKTKTKPMDNECKISKELTSVKKSLKLEHSHGNKANMSKVINEASQKSSKSKSSQERKTVVEKGSKLLERKPDLKRKQNADNAKAKVEESLLKIMMENEESSSKYKIPIAYRRVKRQASLNASAFVNILYEKQVPVPKSKETKDDTKRSKSESDLLKVTKSLPVTSHSFSESPSKEESLVDDAFPSSMAVSDAIVDQACNTNNELKSPSKDDVKSPSQKLNTQTKCNVKSGKDSTNRKKKAISPRLEKASTVAKQSMKMKGNADKTKVKKTVKSSENNVDKKKKSNLAKMNRAKEISKTGKRQKAKVEKDFVSESSDSDEITDIEIDSAAEDEQEKRQKTDLFHAARTHVIVNRKQMYGEKLNWCDCCQMYYSDPGRTYWTNKELVDQGQKNSQGQPIQSSSADLSSTSVEVRPYTGQSHAPMEGSPYVGQVVSHGHVPSCSSCGCTLPGSQCRHYSLGGVGAVPNVQVLSCHPGYNSAYPVQYQLPGSYGHCGTCCSNGPYHATGAPVLRQPQLAMSADTSILLRHPVPLQMAHDASRPMSLQMSHGDTSIHCVHHMSHHCHTSPGEITNISIGRNITLDALDHAPADIDVCGDDEVIDSKSQITILDEIPGDKTYTSSSLGSMSNISEVSEKCSTLANNQGTREILDSIESANSTKLHVPYTNIKSVTEDASAINKNRNRKMTPSELQSKVLKKKKTSDNDIDIDKSQEIVKQTELNVKDSNSVKVHKQSESSKSEKDKGKRKKSQNEATMDGKGAMKAVTVVAKAGEVKVVPVAKASEVKAEPVAKAGEVMAVPVAKAGEVKATPVAGEVKGPGDKEKKAKKSVAFHGWRWYGQPEIRTMTQVFDGRSVRRKCYPAIRHEDGDIIQVKDSVLVCSGPRKVDIPYVAKVTCFWECPETLEMMMTVLWYYRPEHTEGGRQPFHMDCELFAAKHRDESLVACIDDKGYVLTQNEYCRFRAEMARIKSNRPPRENIIPNEEDPYPSRRIPPLDVDPENVFICRHVYDFKLKRVLKNPS